MLEKLYEFVENTLPPMRYKHTLGVVEVAKKLALEHNISETKAETAALLHDISKCMTISEMHNYIECDETLKYFGNLGELLHGFAGSVYAKQKLDVFDEDILNAIKYHTVGRRGMTTLEKIIYIADAIEPGRNYPSVDEIRKKATTSINHAIIFEVDRKLKYLLKIEAIIHPNTIEMRNCILEELKNLKS
ncbi:MAG: bis(5'-nucleosyl)-tetraphosphatase (symmetrical) YqeK [Psychrilyobacter sp.]|nr:bis(5'-nucleosyl)-tetraphosphatase (symmetrical) YqeK [Psychrilyobacter sp.]